MSHFVDAILDALIHLVAADLVTVLENETPEVLRVLGARGPLARASVTGHRIDLATRPGLRRLLAGTQPGLLDDDHIRGEADPFVELVPLPEDHACLAAPLRHQGALVGALTLDSRSCGAFGDETLRAVAGFASLAAWAIHEAHRAERLDRSLSLISDRLGRSDQEQESLGLVGRSHPWRRALEQARLAAPTEAVVLLSGETGTGKERVARAIHAWSPRAAQPFVALNCAVLQPQLATSELFGHERGAFTGADRRRTGRFELAEGGTIFLDEVAELPAETQAQLLRVLEERTFERVGGTETLRTDVRVIAASHRDLGQEVRAGRFRDDLYYRLAIFPLFLPPLRERTGDIPILVRHMISALGSSGPGISRGALLRLEEQAWPGNVRELANVLERARILSGGAMIDLEHLDFAGPGPAEPRGFLALAVKDEGLPARLGRLDRAQAREILAAVADAKGKISGVDGAAALLGLKATTLRSRMVRLGIL